MKFATRFAAYNNAMQRARTPEDVLKAKEDNPFLISKEQALQYLREGRFGSINVGVDFGGNGSGHTFVATTNIDGFDKLIALRSERHIGDEIDPEVLADLFIKFIKRIIADYGYVLEVGEISMSGPAEELLHNPKLVEAYLGG